MVHGWLAVVRTGMASNAWRSLTHIRKVGEKAGLIWSGISLCISWSPRRKPLG